MMQIADFFSNTSKKFFLLSIPPVQVCCFCLLEISRPVTPPISGLRPRGLDTYCHGLADGQRPGRLPRVDGLGFPKKGEHLRRLNCSRWLHKLQEKMSVNLFSMQAQEWLTHKTFATNLAPTVWKKKHIYLLALFVNQVMLPCANETFYILGPRQGYIFYLKNAFLEK
jgi:hypothetical protein